MITDFRSTIFWITFAPERKVLREAEKRIQTVSSKVVSIYKYMFYRLNMFKQREECHIWIKQCQRNVYLPQMIE